MNALKVVIAGAGKRATHGYIPILQKMTDHFQLTAICDTDREKAESVAQNFGIRAYTDISEMASTERAEIAIIAVSPMSIRDATVHAIEYDAHVLVETPIGVDLNSADQIRRRSNLHGTKCEVAEISFRRPHERIKQEMIKADLFGEISFAYCRFVGQGYHAANLLRSYVGFNNLPRSVSAYQADFKVKDHNRYPNINKTINQELWQHGIVTFQNGSKGIYDFTTLAYGSPIRGNRTLANTEIYGEKGMMIGIEPKVLGENSEMRSIAVRRRNTEVDGVEVLDAYIVDHDQGIVWENPFREYPFNDAQIALADCLTSLETAIRNGTDPEYGFQNARIDREIDIAFGNSANFDGRTIEIN